MKKTSKEIERIQKEISLKRMIKPSSHNEGNINLEMFERKLEKSKKNFRSKQGKLLYLDNPVEHLIAISFNKMMWAHKSCIRENKRKDEFIYQPNHELNLMTDSKTRSKPSIYHSSSYTGGIVGIYMGNDKERTRGKISKCTFQIDPFSYFLSGNKAHNELKEKASQHKEEYPRRLIGYGDRAKNINWIINIPSEIIADYRIVNSLTNLRESLFPEKWKE